MKQATIMEMTIMTTKGIIDETKKKAALSMPVDPENPVITEMNQYQWFENDEGIQIVHEVWTKDGVALTENEVKKVKTVISVESTKENEEDRIEQIEGHAYFFGDEPRIFEWRWKERREDQKSWTKVLLYSGKRSYLLDAEMNEEGGKARFDSRMTAGKYHVYFLGENSVSKLKMLDPGVFSFQPERMEGGRSYVLSYEDNQWILSVTSLVSAVVIEKAKTQKQGVEIQTEKIEIENEIIGADFVLYGTQTKHMEIVSAKLVNGGVRASFP
ncbi:MAG TPA: hypothetical protein DHN33_01770, partial [Eubacteriaceae bacterium]|nr:hypothetical protein [Eubacteriaceae bacterium]